MSIETILLILESVLLAATIVLLLFSIREGRGRSSLLEEIGKAVRILTRHEYFLTVEDSMSESEREVVGCITGRMPSGEDKRWTRDLMEIISRRNKGGVKVRYILPKLQDRLHCAFIYSGAGAEVRFSSRPIAHDIRYMVVDGRQVVIGVPETTGEKEATKKGYRIPSEGLAEILREHFYSCWEQSTTYSDYLKETLKQTGTTPKHLARELQIDEAEIERFAGAKELG